MDTTQDMPQTRPTLDGRITSVLRYWDQLRGDRVAPGRIEISPAAISRHLSRICIVERPRAGTVRLRLAGATVSSRAGMELRGMPFRSLFDLDDRNVAMDAVETAITTPAVTFLALGRKERTGTQAEATMAILPLTDTQGHLTRAMTIYAEHASITPFVSDVRGRFLVTDSWSLDIPETGSIVGPMGEFEAGPATQHLRSPMKPTATTVMRPRLASQSKTIVAAQTLPHHSRPVFKVIDGGLD